MPTGTYFADWVAPAAQKAFEADFGEVKVRTTLDADLQRLAVRAVGRRADRDAQAALVAMRPDGRVVAMVGGRSYKASPFNRATQARRQPGSAFKLFVYLAALRAGWTPDSIIEDRPVTIGGWTPVNSDRRLSRADHAARGLRPVEQCGDRPPVGERRPGQCPARRARARHFNPIAQQPSVALGTAGVSLLELTSAYAAIASGRYPIAPRGLALDGQDEGFASYFRRGGSLDQRRDWAPMLDLLWEAANKGTGRRAALAVPTFGKTGTSQDNRDALFIGFAGNLVVGVWVGRDDNKSLGKITGGTRAGADLARFHGPGAQHRRPRRAAVAADLPSARGAAAIAPPGEEEPAARRLERWHPRLARAGRRTREFDRGRRRPVMALHG